MHGGKVGGGVTPRERRLKAYMGEQGGGGMVT